MIEFFIFAIIAYFFGSLPCGVWVGKIAKKLDIRNYGSKNSGATNAYRVLGAKYGVLVLILDVLKGFIPLFLASLVGIESRYIILLGMIAILGHTFSFFLNFRGGKGVATSLGVFLFLMPEVIMVLLIVFILTVFISRYVSLGSVVCASLLPLLSIFMPLRYENDRILLVIIAFFIGVFVIYKHKTNIQRLMNGTENKFKLK